MASDPDLYLCENVRHRLALDPRVADLALTVEMAGGRLHVIGSVTTEERRRAAGEVAVEAAGGHAVVNDVTVVPLDGPAEPEHLR